MQPCFISYLWIQDSLDAISLYLETRSEIHIEVVWIIKSYHRQGRNYQMLIALSGEEQQKILSRISGEQSPLKQSSHIAVNIHASSCHSPIHQHHHPPLQNFMMCLQYQKPLRLSYTWEEDGKVCYINWNFLHKIINTFYSEMTAHSFTKFRGIWYFHTLILMTPCGPLKLPTQI